MKRAEFPSPTDSRQVCYFALVAAIFLLASGLSRADEGASALSLQEYLGQVRHGNTGTVGNTQASEAQHARAPEGELLLTPTAFANAQYSHDGKPQLVPITSYAFQDIWQYSLGVSQLTTFGLQAKVSTNLYTLNYVNPSSFFTVFGADPYLASLAGLNFPGTINVTNQLELTQSLWGNGFGSATRANQELIEAQALAQSYGSRYTARGSLVDAETAYWRLVTARDSVELTRANLERAQKTYDWNARRARLQLADESDELQSQAQLESRKLEYQRAQDDEKTAARAFNTARGIASDIVAEKLATITPSTILEMQPPKRGELRDDVRSAEQQTRAAVASDTLAREREKPTLDVFGTFGLNGQAYDTLGNAYSQALSLDHPTVTAGLRFSAALAPFFSRDMQNAYSREAAAADLTYERKVFEQEQGWKDLNDRLTEAKRRLELSVSLEKVQQAKLFHERDRYSKGRTTAFQVLSFETDYAQSELTRISAEADVLTLLTQMKLYGEEL